MNTWIGSAELAEILGIRQQSVSRRATAENCQSRRRQGRGGGREYHLASLPTEWRQRIAAHRVSLARETRDPQLEAYARRRHITGQIAERVALRVAAQGLARLAHLDGADRARAEAKLSILEAIEDFTAHSHLTKTAALTAFCAAYNDGSLKIEEEAREVVESLNATTVYRWRRELKERGAAALAGSYGNRKGSGVIDSQEALHDFCVAMLTQHPHTSGANLFKAVRARFRSSEEVQLPSKRAVQRWLATFRDENAELITAIANPDGWKNKYMTAYGSADEDVVRLNQRWEGDATPADVMLLDGRHHIMGWVDIFSRRGKLLVTKTSTAQAVATSLRRSILHWGVPDQVKTDNGSDYKSKRIRRVFDQLGVEHLVADPFSGWQKPHIERFFRTFSHGIVEYLPGYSGHNVAERKQIEARKSFADRLMKKNEVIEIRMTSAEFQDLCDRWVEDIYHNDTHGKLGVSPNVKAAGQPARRIEDERALDILLADCGVRTVTKSGITIDRIDYISAELDCVGAKVHVLKDPEDLGRIFVFRDGEFLCIAENPVYAGISRREVAIRARERQKQRIQDERRQLRAAARKERVVDIAQEILSEAGKAREGSNIHAFPTRDETYTTPALGAASAAADARDRAGAEPEAPEVTRRALETVTRMIREEQLEDETAEDRFRRWIRVDRARAAGEEINDIDAAFASRYEESAEFKGRYLIYEEFGASAFGL